MKSRRAKREKELRANDARRRQEQIEAAQKCPSVGRSFCYLPGHGHCIVDSLTGYYWKAIEGQINKWQRIEVA